MLVWGVIARFRMEKPEGAFTLLKKENKNILKSFFFALFSVEKPKIHSEESDRQEKKKKSNVS